MEPIPPKTGLSDPNFSGINPVLLREFISSLQYSRDLIGEQSEAIRRRLILLGMPTLSLQPVREIEAWLDEELPVLRRREKIISREPVGTWLPGMATGVRPFDESRLLTPAEAREKGRALGERLKGLGDVSRSWLPLGTPFHHEYLKVIGELAALKNNADFTAAFFATLGPEETLRLHTRLAHNIAMGGPAGPFDPDNEVLRVVSEAFGTAVSAGTAFPGFARVKDAVAAAARKGSYGADVLLSAGEFPPGWLAGIAAPRLVSFTTTPRHASPVSAPLLYALGNNPAAARLALTAVTKGGPLGPGQEDTRPELGEFLKTLHERSGGLRLDDAARPGSRTRFSPEGVNADAFGRMLAAASGAYDEQDGRHSREAAKIAFTVMTTFGHIRMADPVKIHFSEIAGAYATEITEGANLRDNNMSLPSSFTQVSNERVGLNSAFRLSPGDTYRFLRTFADTQDHLTPFQEGMGDLAQRLIKDGAEGLKRSGDITSMDLIFSALGYVRGAELAATEKVQGHLDARDRQNERNKSLALGIALGGAGLFVPGGQAGQVVWFALSGGVSAVDTLAPDSDTRLSVNEKADREAVLGRRHAIVVGLMANGFTPKVSPAEFQAECPPGVAIADSRGHLRPFSDILKSGNAGIEAFERWLALNAGSENTDDLKWLADKFAEHYEGAARLGKARAFEFN